MFSYLLVLPTAPQVFQRFSFPGRFWFAIATEGMHLRSHCEIQNWPFIDNLVQIGSLCLAGKITNLTRL